MLKARAFSLLEVVLAALIFSTIAIFLMGVWTAHARAMAKARHQMTAAYLGQKVMEECLLLGFDNIDSLASLGSQDYSFKVITRGVEVNVVYSAAVTVKLLTPEQKFVEVEVTWNEGVGAERLNYETLLVKS